MATASKPAGVAAPLAAAVSAGVNPKVAQQAYGRSQYLAQVLAALQQNGGQNIRSPAQLGLNLLAMAVASHGKRSADQGVAEIQRQIAAQLYPNDQRAQLLYLTSPEDMAKAAAQAYAPMAVRAGETVTYGQGGPTYTAPILRDDGGVFGNQTLEGFTPTGTRQMNYGEQTSAAQQQEAARHNLATEKIDSADAAIRQGMLEVALKNAGTQAGQLNLAQTNSPQFAPPPRFTERVR
jgi:hypothetical protein